jgi:hypothetical protein
MLMADAQLSIRGEITAVAKETLRHRLRNVSDEDINIIVDIALTRVAVELDEFTAFRNRLLRWDVETPPTTPKP